MSEAAESIAGSFLLFGLAEWAEGSNRLWQEFPRHVGSPQIMAALNQLAVTIRGPDQTRCYGDETCSIVFDGFACLQVAFRVLCYEEKIKARRCTRSRRIA